MARTNDDLTKRTGELARMGAQRRQALTEWTPDSEKLTKVDDDGDHIIEKTVRGPGETEKTVEVNLSSLFHPAVSTTGNVEILVLEAELAAEGECGDNPHIPVNEETLEAAINRIEAEGLAPAWEVV